MAKINYTIELDPETTAKAMAYELHVSPKKSREVGRFIKGMHSEDAKAYLEDVIKFKKAIPFKKHNDSLGHKKGGMAAGRYPINVAKEFLKLIKSAEHNAEYKGLDSKNMRIAHVASKRGNVIHGMRPRAKGRSSPKNTETVTLEIIIRKE